jgi:hypothetical protein
VLYVGGGPGSVIIKCPARGITLRGDSAQEFSDHDQMIGHATYDEPRLHLAADFLNYFSVEDRVTAAGNVHARLPSGSTLDGPQAEFLHASPRVRPHDQMRAVARPTITIVEKDSTGKPAPPMTVVAETVFVDNDSLIYGSGHVEITRPNLAATSDSAFIDKGKETMRLSRGPKVTGNKTRPFTLTGNVIDLYSKNQKLQRVLARPNAVAVSDSMTLSSDTIDLRVVNDQLDHAYAWSGSSVSSVPVPPPASVNDTGKAAPKPAAPAVAPSGKRAHVISPSQNLTADSLDVSMPNQHVQLVRAVRGALAEAKLDTTHFKVEKPDTLNWLQGDTIVAHFDTLRARDTTHNPEIRQLVASGHASSLYHMAPSDTSEHRPAINHVVARMITIDFDSQKVATVTTVDSVLGIYLEPQHDSTKRAAGQPATSNAKPHSKQPATPPGKTPPATPPKPIKPEPFLMPNERRQ